ncbi:MAG: carboxypeptidase regulatory-like domain-containing protein, partial [Planctomycetes bacterium]|nr:carboxypeptidase regulatory-like domain-containing protein [Planctomycetota bacterium]
MQSPEFLQSVLVAFLGQAIHLFEDTADDSEEGLFQSLAEALLPVLSQWHLSADDTFSTAVSIRGNTIESYRTAIETNFFQASVTNNHITMRQRQEIRVELLARINGIVIIEDGLPIPGAHVTIEGTGQGVTTCSHGTFALADVPPGEVQL